MAESQPRVIDYGESTYKRDFWEKGREYEDLAERAALRRLLPPTGRRILEVGAGFGRLVPVYAGHSQVVLLDYSKPLLADARSRFGDSGVCYAAGNWYTMPFADGAFDTVVTVRVLHHAEDLPRLFREIARVLAPGATFVLEFASKCNLKAVLRRITRRQAWSPFTLEPVEFYPLHWDFHPRYVRGLLRGLGFTVSHPLAVSHLRADALKRHLPPAWLARADAALQPIGRWLLLTPSVFMRARAPGTVGPVAATLFRCPRCATPLPDAPGDLTCPRCGARWARDGGIYDFHQPAP